MELQKTTSRILALFALILCLGGCETHLNSEPLEIIGNPPKEMFYESEFAYQFGVKGGDGLYSFRYIANPDDVSESQSDARNPVELRIDELDGNKPGFWLRGMPTIDSDEDFLAVPERELVYEIEVSDGASTVRRQFEFTLKKNALVLTTPLASTRERQISNSRAKSLLSSRESGSTRACRQGVQSHYESSVVNGQLVYPLVMGVNLKSLPSRRVEIGYRFVSTYSDSEGELSSLNLERARPNVDYLDEERTVIFEPGETNCIIYLNVLDDNQVEGLERLEVHFFDRTGGKVDITGAVGQILITENEPIPKYTPRKVTANEGDTVITEFSVTQPYSMPIDILVSVDSAKTTADSDDFVLQPLDGRVTIPAGATKASYAVTLLHNDDSSESVDEVVAIKTSLDERNNVEPMEIAINKWFLANEIVGRQSLGSEVVDFVYGEGNLFVLSKMMTLTNEEAFAVNIFNASGQAVGQTALEIGQQGLNISPVAIVFDNSSKIVVVANVDGQFSGQPNYGERDFLVASFAPDVDGRYQTELVRQFGTEGDDEVTGIVLGADGREAYIYGRTNGDEFDGSSGSDLRQGGNDGFIYRVDPGLLTKRWAKFVGTGDMDSVASVNVSGNNLIALVNSQNTDSDVFMRVLSSSEGQLKEFAVEGDAGQPRMQVDISSPRDDTGVGVTFKSAGTSFIAVVNSDADLPDFNLTPSGSSDSFVIAYDSESGVSSGTTRLATALDDQASALAVLNEDGDIAVGGVTMGEFPDQTRKGLDNNDAFVANISKTESGQTALSNVSQFGTLSNDEVIKIERINDHKFMVLWSESTTSGNGSKVYRLSPFSIDGTKLTPDP